MRSEGMRSELGIAPGSREWAEMKLKVERQVQCLGCGRTLDDFEQWWQHTGDGEGCPDAGRQNG